MLAPPRGGAYPTDMSPDLLPCVEVEPEATAERCVIWMHGLGADGHDFEPIVPDLGLSALNVRFVFPHAPVIPVTINAGMRMRAWYDITSLGADRSPDVPGVEASAVRLADLLAREAERGVPSDRTVVAGFSQGGAIALHQGLRHPERLAGIVGLSTWMPTEASLDGEASPANAETPVFLAHGTLDPMVPVAAGELARDALARRGRAVDWRTYPMQHQVCQEEILDLAAFLRRCLEPEA